ncbi:sigma 54-interacting transcriptional regulator [Fusobacterium sp. IOR10]|uniref:sigma 54-interacting transcriptional regulator n=1 Tax=Fusobacterium sp. IOR10 TaxID=2665157 RepID=UPI0013D1E75A|nr:sigma-54 dependent transcriptional regulator [Fusobacterium sp. IOR10]
MKVITLIAGTYVTKINLLKQLKDLLFEDVIINGYSLDEIGENEINGDLIVFSSNYTFEKVKKRKISFQLKNSIVAKRTINYNNIDILFNIKDRNEVIFVNDSRESTYEALTSLEEIGIKHIKFIPYYPEKSGIIKKFKIAVTPGEVDKVPPFVEKIYDIGSRLIEMETLILILNKLDLFSLNSSRISNNFLNKIVKLNEEKHRTMRKEKEKRDSLFNIIDTLDKNYIIFYKDELQEFSFENDIVKHIKLQIKYENSKKYLKQGEILEFLKDKNNFSKTALINNSKFILKKNIFNKFTYISIYKEDMHLESNFKGKYFLNHIIGESEKIVSLKNKIEKLSKSEITVLLEGETGTGKELFASAIHNSSSRKNNPFIPINFSSLNETIIESELFGYEKGAFTGASPKGKKGFFELAQGGTIFLDEIGDISLKIQSRLLRVLEEKEIVRIGGEKIIPIDIRIIGATNKDIYQMCKENRFRKDLYYRLRSGYLRIPPLRERKEDIETIIEDFLVKNSYENYEISKKAMDFLKNYPWEGNVRELINTISYAILLSDSNLITIDTLMENDFLKDKIKCGKEKRIFNREEIKKDILNIIKDHCIKEVSIGRTKIFKILKNTYNISEYKVRKLIDELKEEGRVEQGKKSQGIRYIN